MAGNRQRRSQSRCKLCSMREGVSCRRTPFIESFFRQSKENVSRTGGNPYRGTSFRSKRLTALTFFPGGRTPRSATEPCGATPGSSSEARAGGVTHGAVGCTVWFGLMLPRELQRSSRPMPRRDRTHGCATSPLPQAPRSEAPTGRPVQVRPSRRCDLRSAGVGKTFPTRAGCLREVQTVCPEEMPVENGTRGRAQDREPVGTQNASTRAANRG
jgi:hypothetical protein